MSAQRESTTSPLEQFGTFPFDTDQVYQQGLASILTNGALATNTSDEEKEEVFIRARVFYFNKVTGNSLTVDEAKEYEISLQKDRSPQLQILATTQTGLSVPPKEDIEDVEPRVLTFTELKEMIESGRLDQIPNNKNIPNALNEAPPSQSTAQVRKKPWEVTQEGSSTTG